MSKLQNCRVANDAICNVWIPAFVWVIFTNFICARNMASQVARRISFLKRFSWENGNKTSLMTFESRKLFAFRHHVAQIEKDKVFKVWNSFPLIQYNVRVRRVNCTICLFTFICDWQEFFVVEDFTTSRKFLVVFKLSIINSLRSFLADKEFSAGNLKDKSLWLYVWNL